MELELGSIKPAACCRRGLQTSFRVMEAPPSPVSRTSSCFPPPESQAVSGCAGPKRCHARVPIARAPSCRVPRSRRPKQASLGRPETSSRCEITISHCISPPSGFNPTIRAAPEPRADRHALMTLGRARPTPTTTRKRALLPLQRRPGTVLLPEAPRRATRTAAARGRLRRTSSEVGQPGGRLRQRPGRARGHSPSCRRGVRVVFLE